MDLTCAFCGAELVGAQKARRRKFCNMKCYGGHQRLNPHGKSSAGPARPRFEVRCKHCGVAFMSHASRPRSYCSRSCYIAAMSAARTIKECRVCAAPFEVWTSTEHRFTVCSTACKTKDTTHADCPRCGKRFNSKKGTLKFCSEPCRRPASIVECLNCGKRFRVTPTVARRRRHCSFSCYRRYTGETTPERNVRLCLERMGVPFEQEVALAGSRYPVDFLIHGSIVLEVDGAYWHAKSSKRDAAKTARLEAAGYSVVRITDEGLYGDVTDEMVAIVESALAELLAHA